MAEIQLFKSLESEGAKIKQNVLRKLPFKLFKLSS